MLPPPIRNVPLLPKDAHFNAICRNRRAVESKGSTAIDIPEKRSADIVVSAVEIDRSAGGSIATQNLEHGVVCDGAIARNRKVYGSAAANRTVLAIVDPGIKTAVN